MGCMWESFRPGITVRPSPSMMSVPGPLRRNTFSFGPTVVIFPSVIASASTSAGVPFVAILALCSMVSGARAISSLLVQTTKVKAGLAGPTSLLVGLHGRLNHIFGKLCSRRSSVRPSFIHAACSLEGARSGLACITFTRSAADAPSSESP